MAEKNPVKEPLKEFTNNFLEMYEKLNPLDPYKQVFQGKFKQTVEVVGQSNRSMLVYLPQNLEHLHPSLFVISPDGQTADECFEESGWKQIADKHSFHLFILEAKDGKWKIEDSNFENNYINAAFELTRTRPYYNTSKAAYYLVGHEVGGRVAQRFAMFMPWIWAGVSTFNGAVVEESYIDETGKQISDDVNLTKKYVPLPMWIIQNKLDKNKQTAIEYWWKANNNIDDGLKNEYASVYMPSQITTSTLIDEQPLAQLWLTEKPGSDVYDSKFNEVVWTKFLCRTQRHIGIANGNLRPAKNYGEIGIVRKTQVLDGFMREWFEYIPTYVKQNPGIKVPIVVAYHGGGSKSEVFIATSEWYKIAEARNFIVVFPTALPTKTGNGIPHPNWNVTADISIGPDNIPFIREVVKDVQSRFSVDESRIYATGLSNGSAMTQRSAISMPDIFAAAGSVSGVVLKGWRAMFTLPDAKPEYEIPMWIFMGERDIGGGTFDVNKDAYDTVNYWIGRNNTALIDKPNTYKNGRFNNRIYKNSEKVPMVIYSVVDGLPHSNIPQVCWLLWDDFFSKFSRNKDGKVVYENSPITL